MSFESPWMLGLGALAALVPIVVHLTNRRRAKLVRFAALEFLLGSDKRLARRLKVRQWLVLALRVGLLLAVGLALAKPYLAPDRAQAPDASLPGAVVLVVDDSASTLASATGEPGGEAVVIRAIERAEEVLAQGGPRTSFAVIASGAPARRLTPGLTFDREAVREALAELRRQAERGLQARPGDLAEALREAERALAESPEPLRQIYVLGDQAAASWAPVTEGAGPLWAFADPPTVHLEDLGASTDGPGRVFAPGSRAGGEDPEVAPTPDNVALTDVRVVAAPGRPAGGGDPAAAPGGELITGPRLLVEVDVTRHAEPNPAAAPLSVDVALQLGGAPVGTTATLRPGETVTLSFERPRPSGADGEGAWGTARLLAGSGGALGIDDAWPFTVASGRAVPVLVVNGAPRAVPHLDELYFLRPALRARPDGASRLGVRAVGLPELDARRLDGVDVVVLANVGALTSEQRALLEAFVRDGGGLLTTAGDQLTPEAATSWGLLLPLPIRAVKEIVDPRDPSAALRAPTLDQVTLDHPIFAPFRDLEDASLFATRVFTHALLDAVPRPEARVLASLSGGQPLLVEGRLGDGRLGMLATTIDRDWSDLVVRTAFVPLVQQLVRHLAGRLGSSELATVEAGETVRLWAPDGLGALTLERPDGGAVPMIGEAVTGQEPGLDPAGIVDPVRERVVVDRTLVPGHYTLRRVDDPAKARAFAVHSPIAESDLRRADPSAVRAALDVPGVGVAPPPRVAADVGLSRGRDAGDASPGRTNVWPYVLLGLFGLLLAETWLALRDV